MTCRECTDFLMDYLSGELPENARAHFQTHLNACPNCVRYLKTYEATVALGRIAFESSESEVPPEVPEELIQAILSAQRHAQ